MDRNHPEMLHGLKKSEQAIQSSNRREIARMHRELLRRIEKEERRLNRKQSERKFRLPNLQQFRLWIRELPQRLRRN
jgi:hypothetical protein